MAVRPNGASASSSISPRVIIATIAIVVILIIGVAWYMFGTHSSGAQTRPPTADELWFQQKAKESGGEYDKLSQDDKRKLFALDGPQAPFLLRQAAKDLKVGQ